MNETATIIGIKAGMLASILTYFTADTHMVIVLIVGILGGVAGYFKEVTHLEVKSTFPRMLSEFFIFIPLAISLAVLVANVGGNLYPMKWGWIGVSFIVAIHAKLVLATLAPMAKILAGSATDVLSSMFKSGGKK